MCIEGVRARARFALDDPRGVPLSKHLFRELYRSRYNASLPTIAIVFDTFYTTAVHGSIDWECYIEELWYNIAV